MEDKVSPIWTEGMWATWHVSLEGKGLFGNKMFFQRFLKPCKIWMRKKLEGAHNCACLVSQSWEKWVVDTSFNLRWCTEVCGWGTPGACVKKIANLERDLIEMRAVWGSKACLLSYNRWKWGHLLVLSAGGDVLPTTFVWNSDQDVQYIIVFQLPSWLNS